MEITIDHTPNSYGLTKKNLAIPDIIALLMRHGVTVTHPNSEHAVLKSRRTLTATDDFKEQVKLYEKKYEQEPELEPILEKQTIESKKPEPAIEQPAVESLEYSWPVLNGFMIALGAGVVATGLVLLSGAPALIAALVGISVGIAALLTYGLFDAINKEQSNEQNQFMPDLGQ